MLVLYKYFLMFQNFRYKIPSLGLRFPLSKRLSGISTIIDKKGIRTIAFLKILLSLLSKCFFCPQSKIQNQSIDNTFTSKRFFLSTIYLLVPYTIIIILKVLPGEMD
jgi:hypothetical protein